MAGTAFAITKAFLRRPVIVIVCLFLRRHEAKGVGVLLRIIRVYHLPSGGFVSTGVVEAGGVGHIVSVPVAEFRNPEAMANDTEVSSDPKMFYQDRRNLGLFLENLGKPIQPQYLKMAD
nr:hypothetical protein Iba_chr04aCG3740 [Ipomoea batatas]